MSGSQPRSKTCSVRAAAKVEYRLMTKSPGKEASRARPAKATAKAAASEVTRANLSLTIELTV